MRELEMPDALAGVGLDAHEGLAEQIVSKAMAAIHVAGRRRDGHVHVAKIFIGTEKRPHGGLARVLP